MKAVSVISPGSKATAKNEEESNGDVGYIYVPSTGVDGPE